MTWKWYVAECVAWGSWAWRHAHDGDEAKSAVCAQYFELRKLQLLDKIQSEACGLCGGCSCGFSREAFDRALDVAMRKEFSKQQDHLAKFGIEHRRNWDV